MTVPGTVPAPGVNESGTIDDLRRTVQRFRAYRGPIHPSPVFGAMSIEQATQLQVIHGAHHLGFLHPNDGPA